MRPRNPYAQPFYYSVALAYLGIALLGLAIEDYTSRSPAANDQDYAYGCGTADASIGAAPYPADFRHDLAAEGAVIFRAQCASCHHKNMRDNLTGPALGGVRERWAAYPAEDLRAWIRNSQAMVEAGHPRAGELWAEWAPTVMPAFPTLTDEEVEGLLLYVEAQYAYEPTAIP